MAASPPPAFLIDANLPLKVACWTGPRFLHVHELGARWSDAEIWSYARQHHLTIVSKDKDFLLLQIKEGSPSQLVHIKFGNLKFTQFIERIEVVWPSVESMLEHHSVINIYSDKIEAIK